MTRVTLWALMLFGVLCFSPSSVGAQSPEALYQAACDDGDLDACNVFGLMVETGQQVARDPTRAFDLYLRASGDRDDLYTRFCRFVPGTAADPSRPPRPWGA